MVRKTAALALVLCAACAWGCGDKKSSSSKSSDEGAKKEKTEETSSSSTASASETAGAADSATAAALPEDNKGKELAGMPADAMVLNNGEHKLAVLILPDGKTTIYPFDSEGNPISEEKVEGKVRAAANDWITVAKEKPAVAVQLAALDVGLTTVELQLKVDGKEFNESIDVPETGTKGLVDKPEIVIAEGTKGPNGGTVDVVGNQRVELVTDETTGDIRVYFLDEKLKVMDIPAGTDFTINVEDGKVAKK